MKKVEKKCGATKVQTLIFDNNKFDILSAKIWALEHGYKANKDDLKENTYRIRQRHPSEFKAGTFRTIPFGKDTGIKAVIGCPIGSKFEKGGVAGYFDGASYFVSEIVEYIFGDLLV